MSNILNLFQIKMQISQFVNYIWDQTFGGTDHAKEQINMKMINFHPNIMNMKSGRSGVGSVNVPRYLSKSITCCMYAVCMYAVCEERNQHYTMFFPQS